MTTQYAFISRHTPTQEQRDMVRCLGIELVHVGDMDAFTISPRQVAEKGTFTGVVVVHPAAALQLIEYYDIGIFENGQRAEEGGKPTFFPKHFHRYYRKASFL